jgi:hypothetical protein
MAHAYIDAAEVQFPARCIGCGGEAQTSHNLSARRGIDLIFGRVRGDVLLEWFSLGARVDYLRGEGAPLRFAFRRPEYASVWLEANPRAVRSRDLLRKPTMTATEPSAAPAFSRKTPALTLLVSLALLALHH